MNTADNEWAERLKVFTFLLLYITGLWGQAGSLLPEPFNYWHGIPYQLLGSWWNDHVPLQLTSAEQIAAFQVVMGYLLAFAVPLLALRLLGISPRQAGLGLWRSQGLLITAVGVVVTLPVGFWLAMVTPNPWGSPLQEALEFITLVPEHFLVFGVFGVLLLPGRQLVWPTASRRLPSPTKRWFEPTNGTWKTTQRPTRALRSAPLRRPPRNRL